MFILYKPRSPRQGTVDHDKKVDLVLLSLATSGLDNLQRDYIFDYVFD